MSGSQENFAPFHISKNGHSSMLFDVDVKEVHFKNGALSSKKSVGTWRTENPTEFRLNQGMKLGDMAAKKIYKIAIVLVSNAILTEKFQKMLSFSLNLFSNLHLFRKMQMPRKDTLDML